MEQPGRLEIQQAARRSMDADPDRDDSGVPMALFVFGSATYEITRLVYRQDGTLYVAWRQLGGLWKDNLDWRNEGHVLVKGDQLLFNAWNHGTTMGEQWRAGFLLALEAKKEMDRA
jgi:hypothetical protein